MKKNLFLIWMVMMLLMFVAGCSSEQVQQASDTLVETGEVVVDGGAAVMAVNPQIGVMVVTVGGLMMAIGKALGLFDKGKGKRNE